MGASDLIFDIFAIDRASAVFDKVALSADATANKVKRGSGIMGDALMGAGVVAAAVGVKSIEMAASFDQAMTRLTTTAGESPAALGMVSKGILAMTSQVGYSAHDLVNAMYEVESGGYHGAQGLKVLKDAAMGARVEGANVTDVAHALTGALNDYRGSTLTSTEAVNAMTAAVGHGMMRFQDLAEAMPKIGARASATGIKLQEMLAAMATMTSDGLPATVAATYLGQAIGKLANPTGAAASTMEGLGINALAVGKAITGGSGHGLADAINLIYTGLLNHLVAPGLVSVETFKKMSKSTSDYQKVLANLPPTIQTQIGALANMTGGVRSFQGILSIGGAHMKTQYLPALQAINEQVAKGGTTVAGFAEANKGLANQWADLKGAASSLGVEIGNDLMPAALDLTHGLQDLFGYLQEHKDVVEAVGTGVAAAAVAFTAYKVVAAGVAVVDAVVAGSEALVALQLTASAVAAGDAAGAFARLSLVMDATPWGAAIAAIGLVVGGFALLNGHLGGVSKETKQVADLQHILNTHYSSAITPLKDLSTNTFDYSDALGKVAGQLKIVNKQQALADALRGASTKDKTTGMTPLEAASQLGISDTQLAKIIAGQGGAALDGLKAKYGDLAATAQATLQNAKSLAAQAEHELAASNHITKGGAAASQQRAQAAAQAAADQKAADQAFKLYEAQNKVAQALGTVMNAAGGSAKTIGAQEAAMVNDTVKSIALKGAMDGLTRKMTDGETVGHALSKQLVNLTDNAAANKTNIDNLSNAFKNAHLHGNEITQALSDLGLKGTALGNAVLANLKPKVDQTAKSLQNVAPAAKAATDQVQQMGNKLPSMTLSAGKQTGSNLDAGLISGLVAGSPGVNAAAAQVVNGAEASAKAAAQIHSPSKKWEKIGYYAVDGLVVGLTRSQHLAEEAARQIAEAMHKSLMRGLHVEKLQLGFDLQAANSKATAVADQIKAAQAWGSPFLGNVFSQGLETQQITDANGNTQTVPRSAADIISAMLNYEQGQANDAGNLSSAVATLKGESIASGLLDQMQQAGPGGLQEILALATASPAQVQQLSGLFNQTQSMLDNSGAEATANQSMASLKAQQAKDDRMVNNIKKALHGVELQIADNGHKVRVTG